MKLNSKEQVRLTVCICSFIIYLFCCTSLIYCQQTMSTSTTPIYFSVYNPAMFDNKEIPGFIQEIPADFGDIISLHKEKIADKTAVINKMIEEAENTLLVTPENDILLFKVAILYYERKDFDKAEPLFEKLAKRSAKTKIFEDSLFYWGLISAQHQAYEEAKYFFKRVTEINKKRFNAYINLGLSLFYLNDYAGAIEAFESALILKPRDALAYFYMAIVNYKKGDIKKAQEEFIGAKNLPSEDIIFSDWVDIMKEKDKQEVNKLLQAIKEYPKKVENYHKLGVIYLPNEIDKAQLYFERALEINPRYSFAYEGLSYVYLLRGDFKKAESMAFKRLEYDPGNKQQAYTLVGRIRIHAQDYKGAEEILKKSIEVSWPGEVHFPRSLLGLFYVGQGRIQESEEQLKECIKTGQKDDVIDILDMKIKRYKRIHGIQ